MNYIHLCQGQDIKLQKHDENQKEMKDENKNEENNMQVDTLENEIQMNEVEPTHLRCEVCNKTYKAVSQFRNHMSLSHGNADRLLVYCREMYTKKSKTEFVCNVCGSMTKTRSAIATHLGQKPHFHCLIAVLFSFEVVSKGRVKKNQVRYSYDPKLIRVATG